MEEIVDMLPFIIPIAIIEIGLFIYTMHHILTHNNYKRWNRTTWIIIVVVFMNFVGPILYFTLGKGDDDNECNRD